MSPCPRLMLQSPVVLCSASCKLRENILSPILDYMQIERRPLMSIYRQHTRQAESSSRTLAAAAAEPAASSASSPGDACAANPAVPTPWLMPFARLRLVLLGRPAPLRLCTAPLLTLRAGVKGCRPCNDILSGDQAIVVDSQV